MAKRRLVYVPIDELPSADVNPKAHDTPSTKQSMQRFGFLEPTILDERTGKLVAGHGRRDTLREMRDAGDDAPEGIIVHPRKGWTAPLIVGWSSRDDVEAVAAGVALNHVGEGLWDLPTLNEVLDDVAAHAELGLEGLGYSAADLDVLHAQLDELELPGDERSKDSSIADDADLFTLYSFEMISALAFEHYRLYGYPYPDVDRHVGMQEINRLAVTADHVLASTSAANRVADRFHHHRYALGSSKGWKTRLEVFDTDKGLNRIFELCRTWRQMIDDSKVYTNSGFAIGARTLSNFRPGFALLMARRYAPMGGTWLDCSTGFGGRLVAFFASHMRRYIGLDPSTLTYEGNLAMCDWYQRADQRVDLHCTPAEDFTVRASSVDFCMTSPPYFTKERYSEEPTQSCVRYPQPEAWRDGFLIPFLELQWRALKRDRFAVVNIANVTDDPSDKSSVIPLELWTVEAAKELGFEHVSVDEYPLSRVPNHQGDERRFEPALVFRKP